MRLKDTGLTAQDIKDKVSKYMIETMSVSIFLQRQPRGCISMMRMEHHILTFYAGIAVNNAKQKPEGCSSSQRPGGRYNAHI